MKHVTLNNGSKILTVLCIGIFLASCVNEEKAVDVSQQSESAAKTPQLQVLKSKLIEISANTNECNSKDECQLIVLPKECGADYVAAAVDQMDEQSLSQFQSTYFEYNNEKESLAKVSANPVMCPMVYLDPPTLICVENKCGLEYPAEQQ